MPIDLYYMPASSPCRAVIMTAKHLNIDLNLKQLNMMEKEHLKPEFVKLNPQHCIPTLVDNGFSLWESRAIMQYLVNQYAPGHSLYPEDAKKRATVDRLLQFDLGSLYSAVGQYFYPQVFMNKPADPEKEQQLKDKLALLDSFLAGNKYVAGDTLTLADLSILASVTTIGGFGYDIGAYPNINAWISRLQKELPYYDETTTEPVKQFKAFIDAKRSQ
ncbi:Glutathione S-transferase 1:-like isoform C [Leptotrombidium deliense]|uniref:Glutathione S-transferase 1:-like isoform C n=1 Tax=Leptotrombidium deliense TaxID=299467 RepID=A0A443SSP0_9ACAR|nr:Glutathione S-transferase 1:-like isoform C [Leptotrombidium deliense]